MKGNRDIAIPVPVCFQSILRRSFDTVVIISFPISAIRKGRLLLRRSLWPWWQPRVINDLRHLQGKNIENFNKQRLGFLNLTYYTWSEIPFMLLRAKSGRQAAWTESWTPGMRSYVWQTWPPQSSPDKGWANWQTKSHTRLLLLWQRF